MKKWILLTAFAGIMQWSTAQLSISTNLRQDAIWDEDLQDWEVLATDENVTFFEFNRELTLFKHTTTTITSTYNISDWEYDSTLVKYTMVVTSDAGNTYDVVIDGINNYIGFFYYRDLDYILVHHAIKDTWFREEE
jgi:hypothetical protein